MPAYRRNRASIEQLHREVAALAEEMRNPAPTTIRATMVPFGIGALFALILIVIVALVAKLV